LAVLYSLAAAPWLLRGKTRPDPDPGNTRVDLAALYGLNVYLWEIFVRAGSEVDGKRLKEVGMGRDFGLNPISVLRQGKEIPVEGEDFILKESDVVAVSGKESQIRAFEERQPDLVVLGRPDGHKQFSWSAFELVEVVTPPRSEAVGKTPRDLRLRDDAGLTCIGIWRGDQVHLTGTRDMALVPGDGLLLFGTREKVRAYRPGPEFRWVQRPRKEEAPLELRRLAPYAALTFLGVLATAAFGWAPIEVAALAGAVLLLLMGALSPKAAYENIQWRTLVLIAGMYPMGKALEKTGAAEMIAGFIVDTAGGYGSLYALIAVAFLAMLLTQPMHNAVVAVIMTPVAIKVAGALSSNPKAFAVAVIAGASASFLMPVGHPAPLLVKEPAGYTNSDYLKFGIVLSLAILVVIAFLVPILWPL
jgi:di/tricarboxylate transporter